MTTIGASPDALILSVLLDRPHATGAACRMSPGEVRSRLAHLESLRLVTSRSDKGTPPSRVYAVTPEGRRKVKG